MRGWGLHKAMQLDLLTYPFLVIYLLLITQVLDTGHLHFRFADVGTFFTNGVLELILAYILPRPKTIEARPSRSGHPTFSSFKVGFIPHSSFPTQQCPSLLLILLTIPLYSSRVRSWTSSSLQMPTIANVEEIEPLNLV